LGNAESQFGLLLGHMQYSSLLWQCKSWRSKLTCFVAVRYFRPSLICLGYWYWWTRSWSGS